MSATSVQTDSAPGQVTLDRLQSQIDWYDRKSGYNQTAYKLLKICTMSAAALVPFLASLPKVPREVTAGLGVLIVILEGLQQVYQYHANWISYRSTSEALNHEKYLYLAGAGAYAKADNPHVLLAEQVESLVSQENTKWTSSQSQNQQQNPPADSKG